MGNVKIKQAFLSLFNSKDTRDENKPLLQEGNVAKQETPSQPTETSPLLDTKPEPNKEFISADVQVEQGESSDIYFLVIISLQTLNITWLYFFFYQFFIYVHVLFALFYQCYNTLQIRIMFTPAC